MEENKIFMTPLINGISVTSKTDGENIYVKNENLLEIEVNKKIKNSLIQLLLENGIDSVEGILYNPKLSSNFEDYKLFIYDLTDKSVDWDRRLLLLKEIERDFNYTIGSGINVVPSFIVKNDSDLEELREECKKLKFSGVLLRDSKGLKINKIKG